MNEQQAQAWLTEHYDVPRETLDRIAALINFLRLENERQNLVSRSTLDQVWARHIVDSAQLLRFGRSQGSWLDLGTGAGFPGLIIALLRDGDTFLVEQRKLRAAFLSESLEILGLTAKTRVICNRAETLSEGPFETISARAFAPLDRTLSIAEHLATEKTRWVLPKGRNAKSELEAVRASWQGDFHLEPSLTDPDAFIIVAEGVRRRSTRRRGR